MLNCLPYAGGAGRVILYGVKTPDGTIQFAVLLREPLHAEESELNRRALAAAKEFLAAMQMDADWLSVSGCSKCHVDDLARFGANLWHIPMHGAWIAPKIGCPKPNA